VEITVGWRNEEFNGDLHEILLFGWSNLRGWDWQDMQHAWETKVKASESKPKMGT
jgi:hypothetical protein